MWIPNKIDKLATKKDVNDLREYVQESQKSMRVFMTYSLIAMTGGIFLAYCIAF